MGDVTENIFQILTLYGGPWYALVLDTNTGKPCNRDAGINEGAYLGFGELLFASFPAQFSDQTLTQARHDIHILM